MLKKEDWNKHPKNCHSGIKDKVILLKKFVDELTKRDNC